MGEAVLAVAVVALAGLAAVALVAEVVVVVVVGVAVAETAINVPSRFRFPRKRLSSNRLNGHATAVFNAGRAPLRGKRKHWQRQTTSSRGVREIWPRSENRKKSGSA